MANHIPRGANLERVKLCFSASGLLVCSPLEEHHRAKGTRQPLSTLAGKGGGFLVPTANRGRTRQPKSSCSSALVASADRGDLATRMTGAAQQTKENCRATCLSNTTHRVTDRGQWNQEQGGSCLNQWVKQGSSKQVERLRRAMDASLLRSWLSHCSNGR